MIKIFFATSNKHKVAEIGAVLAEHGFEVVPRKLPLIEPDFDSLEEVAKFKAQQAFAQLKQPVIVEDTGVFFEGYNNFPGAIAKRVYMGVGFGGLLALIKAAKNKRAFFRTVICFSASDKEMHLFSGKLSGHLIEKIVEEEKDRLPYEKIFVPDGETKTLVELDLAQKNRISHRAQAARKLAEWLKKNY